MSPSPRLKRWMTFVGVAGFAAGIPVGIALNQAYREPLIEDSPWLQRFRERYDPSATQLSKVRRVLAVRDRAVLGVYNGMGGQLPGALADKITNIRRIADERIQAVLDSAQRDKYSKDRREAESASSK